MSHYKVRYIRRTLLVYSHYGRNSLSVKSCMCLGRFVLRPNTTISNGDNDYLVDALSTVP